MFPSGKMKRGEDRVTCAIREVNGNEFIMSDYMDMLHIQHSWCSNTSVMQAKEETGFDIATTIQPQDCLTVQLGPRIRTLFIVQNVPFNFPFKPQTRKEIKVRELFQIHK